MATNVGGTSEIVGDTVGKLLPENVTPEELAREIISFAQFSDEKKKVIRENAYKRFEDMSNADALTKELVGILTH